LPPLAAAFAQSTLLHERCRCMNEDLQSSEESAFVLEDVNLIIKEARARRICDTSAACVALSTLPSCTTLSGH